MAGYEVFALEDLPVWQAASDLALCVFALGEKAPLRRHRSLRDQIERAQLRGWAQHLQDSTITGQRYLTTKTRKTDQARRERDEFVKELDTMRKKT